MVYTHTHSLTHDDDDGEDKIMRVEMIQLRASKLAIDLTLCRHQN
jgi:hypothetical protein